MRLIEGDGRDELAAAAPFRLHAEARRPGLAHEVLVVRFEAPALADLARAAAREGVPLALWAALGIESERALEAVVPPGRRADAVSALDAAARGVRLPGVAATRLEAYAEALRGCVPGKPEPVPDGRLRLYVPYHSIVAWTLAAQHGAEDLEPWLRTRLARLPVARHRWEAAAGAQGATLGEWVSASVARPLARSSTPRPRR